MSKKICFLLSFVFGIILSTYFINTDVYASGCGGCWIFYLKDNQTKITVTTAQVELLTKDPYSYCIPENSLNHTWYFQYHNYYFLQCTKKENQEEPKTVTVSITASGYDSKTAIINPPEGSTVYISKKIQPSPTSMPSNSPNPLLSPNPSYKPSPSQNVTASADLSSSPSMIPSSQNSRTADAPKLFGITLTNNVIYAIAALSGLLILILSIFAFKVLRK